MTISFKGCDFTSRTLTGKTLAASGFVFACRYTVNSPGGQDKQMSRAEIVEKSAAGVRIVNNFEWAANPPDSRATGKAHATANKNALAALGVPDWTMTYYSIDTGLQAGARNNYAAGWRDVYPADQLGVYTCGALFRQLKADGYVTKAWQSMSLSFPGNHLPGQPNIWDHRGADIIQTGGGTVAGHSVDFDTAVVSDYGGWLLGEEDPDMALTDADLDKLFNDPRMADLLWRVYAMANMLPNYNAGSMKGDVVQFTKAIEAIPTTTVPAAPVDTAAIAKAVNDDAAKRLAS